MQVDQIWGIIGTVAVFLVCLAYAYKAGTNAYEKTTGHKVTGYWLTGDQIADGIIAYYDTVKDMAGIDKLHASAKDIKAQADLNGHKITDKTALGMAQAAVDRKRQKAIGESAKATQDKEAQPIGFISGDTDGKD